MRLDSVVKYLYHEINKLVLKDSINVIIVSDHGMTEVSDEKYINIENMLEGINCMFQDYGPFMTINSEEENINKIYYILKEKHFKFYKKENLPKYFHYSKDENIYPIILSVELGCSLITNGNMRNGLQVQNEITVTIITKLICTGHL